MDQLRPSGQLAIASTTEPVKTESFNLTGTNNNNNSTTEQKPTSKTIDLEQIDAPVTDKIKIDFFKDDKGVNSFIANPSEVSKDTNVKPPSSDTGSSSSGPHKFINDISTGSGSGSSGNNDAINAQRGTAKFLVTLFDAVFSAFLRWVAKTDSTTAFSLNPDHIKLVSEALAEVLAEKAVKMSPTTKLVFALLGTYGLLIPEVIKSRKEWNAKFGNLDKKTVDTKATVVSSKTNPPADNQQKPAATDSQQTQSTPQNNANANPINTSLQTTTNTTSPGFNSTTQDPLWYHPDTNYEAKSPQDLKDYLIRGVYPKWFINKINGKRREIKYNKKTGDPIPFGRPSPQWERIFGSR